MKKKCSKCKKEKPADEFGKRNSNKDGLMEVCKPCQKERAAVYDRNKKDEGYKYPFAF